MRILAIKTTRTLIDRDPGPIAASGRFFRDISENRLRRGVFTSVPELIAAIDEYIAHHNAKPKPFIWTASARDVLQKAIRANSRLSSKQNATLNQAAGKK